MLIYNKTFSLSNYNPLTNKICFKITKELIYNKVDLINKFFIENFKFKPKIAV